VSAWGGGGVTVLAPGGGARVGRVEGAFSGAVRGLWVVSCGTTCGQFGPGSMGHGEASRLIRCSVLSHARSHFALALARQAVVVSTQYPTGSWQYSVSSQSLEVETNRHDV
jgi:hypothetical protein